MLEDKKLFVLSTNADKQFEKAGLPAEKIFCTQGDYFHIQCAKGCHPKIYDGVNMFREMDQAREDCKVPAYMVPKCPVCGGAMNMNLRSDNHFVEDEAWHEAEARFGDFISEMLSEKKQRRYCWNWGLVLTPLRLSGFRLRSSQGNMKTSA